MRHNRFPTTCDVTRKVSVISSPLSRSSPNEDVQPGHADAERSLKLILIVGGLSSFGPLSLDMYLPSLPSLSRDFGAGASLTQLTLTACLIGLALGQVLAGPLSDSFGRRRPLLIGLMAYAVTSLLCVFAPSVPALVGLRLLQGVAGSAGIVIARAVVRDLYSGTAAARFFALTMMVNGLAPILAPVIGGQILRVTTWRGVFVVLTLIGMVLLLAAALGLHETLQQQRRQTGGVSATLAAFRRLLTDRSFMGFALSSGLAFASMFSYIAGSPFVLENIYGVSPQLFGLFFGANALGIVAASQISRRLVEPVGSRRLLAVGLGISAIGGILLLGAVLLGVGLPGVLPALFLVVSSIGLIAPNATALALADHPHTAGSASALLGVLQYVIGALMAPLVGIGGSHTAVPMASIIAALSMGAVLTFLLLVPGYE